MKFAVPTIAMVICLLAVGCGRSSGDNSPEAMAEFEQSQQDFVKEMESEYENEK